MVLNAMVVLLIGKLMFNTIFGQGIGLGSASGQQAQNAYPGHYYAQQAAMAQQQAMIGQQQMSAGAMQGISQPMRWMFDGILLSTIDFANKIWAEDCPDKTHFVLKYSKGD